MTNHPFTSEFSKYWNTPDKGYLVIHYALNNSRRRFRQRAKMLHVSNEDRAMLRAYSPHMWVVMNKKEYFMGIDVKITDGVSYLEHADGSVEVL